MANLFTRPNYDINDTMSFNKTNSDYYSYVSNYKVAENAQACYGINGLPNAQSQIARPMNEGMLDLGVKAEIETQLQNRHKELNSPQRTNKDYETTSLKKNTTPGDCSSKETMSNEDSRFTSPIINFREMNTSEYNFNPYLPVDFQKAVVDNTMFLPPTRNGSSSRFDSKKDKYDLKPKEFAVVKPDVDYAKGLLPVKTTVVPAYQYTYK